MKESKIKAILILTVTLNTLYWSLSGYFIHGNAAEGFFYGLLTSSLCYAVPVVLLPHLIKIIKLRNAARW